MGEAPIELLKALAHPLRYAILAALSRKELNVGEIEAVTGIGQPTLSQQLSVLRKAGLVDSRREAKLVFYSVESGPITEIIASLEALVTRQANCPANPTREKDHTGAAVFARLD